MNQMLLSVGRRRATSYQRTSHATVGKMPFPHFAASRLENDGRSLITPEVYSDGKAVSTPKSVLRSSECLK